MRKIITIYISSYILKFPPKKPIYEQDIKTDLPYIKRHPITQISQDNFWYLSRIYFDIINNL